MVLLVPRVHQLSDVAFDPFDIFVVLTVIRLFRWPLEVGLETVQSGWRGGTTVVGRCRHSMRMIRRIVIIVVASGLELFRRGKETTTPEVQKDALD